MFGLHYRIERRGVSLLLAIIVVASIGGLVEIAPLFTIDETVEEAPDMRLYTPLETAGRNIYIREGCCAPSPTPTSCCSRSRSPLLLSPNSLVLRARYRASKKQKFATWYLLTARLSRLLRWIARDTSRVARKTDGFRIRITERLTVLVPSVTQAV